MSDSIKLSPKYGVNPTMPICFFCQKEKGEIALLGHIHEKDANGRAVRGSDIEAPKYMLLDFEPCDECKAKLDNGVTIISVVPAEQAPKGALQIRKGVVPTGAYVVVKEEAYKRIFSQILTEDVRDKMLNQKKVLLEQEIFERIFSNTHK